MLPPVGPLFKLVRDLGLGHEVTGVSVAPWLVRRHGLAPLAAHHGAPMFRAELAQSTLAWSRLTRELPELVGALRDAGIRVASLKGLSYGASMYPTPATRPMSDVDLLVAPTDMKIAKGVLTKHRFVCEPQLPLHHALTFVRGSVVVDLHHDFLGPGRARINFADVWSRTRAHSTSWLRGVEQLDPVDELVFHFVHMARDRLRGPLLHVVDAAKLMQRADLNASMERVHSWGLGRAVSRSHQFCASVLTGDEHEWPAGRVGPSRADIAFFHDWGPLRKIAFDVATAESPTQLLARVASYTRRFSRR
jgi:hypothetical protein